MTESSCFISTGRIPEETGELPDDVNVENVISPVRTSGNVVS